MSKPTLFGRSLTGSVRLAAAVALAAGVSLQAADVTFTGSLKRQYYPGGTRATVANGTATLTSVTLINSGEAPGNVADNYAQRISGWFTPTTSGNYTFAVSSDDDTDLYVSTDATPANKRLVAQQTTWGNALEWATAENGGQSGTLPATQKISDTYSTDGGTTIPFASGIALTAGQRYYIETIMHEGGGGDNLAITAVPFGTVLNNGDATTLTGSVISTVVANPTTLSIATQPASITVSETGVASFTVVLNTDGELTPSFQWRRNGANIPGATSQTYGFVTSVADDGAKFDVVVTTPSLPGLNVLTTTSAEATLTVESAVVMTGRLKREYFPGAVRATVNDGSAGDPSSTTLLTSFEAPNGVADNYAQKVSGFFIPAVTGDYVFIVAADDDADLFLSTDDKPANKRLIAQQNSWGNNLEWNSAEGGAVVDGANFTQKSSLTWSPDAGNTFPFSSGIPLVAGTRYYIEGVHHEGGGGDNFSATFHLNTEVSPENGTASAFTGPLVATLVPRARLTINTQPVSTSAVETRAATFMVDASATGVVGPSYQWRKNGNPIEGATSATYKTPLVTLADNGAIYTCVITAPGAEVTSSPATLTVIPDTFAPIIASAGALRNEAGAVEVAVIFDEVINVGDVIAGNFSLSSGAVTAATYVENSSTYKSQERGVTLSTTGLTAGNTYTLTVRNVRDAKGNAITTATATFTVQRLSWAAIGTQNDGMPAGALAVGDNGVNIQAGGNAFWNATDDATFVYEQVTGDFDKVVRIEEQDSSSQWARAGLMVRESLATDSRHQMAHAPDNRKFDGTASNNAYEGNRRTATGGSTDGAGGGGTPSYPNGTWLRILRTGDVIHIFRSTDGVTWLQYGRTDFLALGDLAPLPATMYVGMVYGPENGNITPETERKLWTARFRNYGDFQPNKARGTQTYSIGANFGADRNSGIMGAREVAGVSAVAQGNWNSLSGNNSDLTGAVPLVAESAGNRVNSTATVTWSGSPNTWASTGAGEENNAFIGSDRSLMTGFLDTGNATTTIVSVSGIPSQLTSGKYDVVIYSSGGVPDRGGAFRVTDANGTELSGYQVILANANPTDHVMLSNPTPLAPSYGTYVVFKGLSAASINIEATTENGLGQSGTPRAPVNAIQLVAPSGLLVPKVNPTIAFDAQGRIVFEGTLQMSPTFNGTYTDVSGATSPYTVNPTGDAGFFRTRQ
jgi:hypothetical protein